MGKGFPLWFGAFMGVLGIALAEEVAKSSDPVKETTQVPSTLPGEWVIAPLPLDSITDPVKHPLLHQMQPIWVSVDYLNYRIRNGPLPTPIVTSGQPGDAIPGAIGQPGTQILLGGPNSNGLDYGALSGIRISGGLYLTTASATALKVPVFCWNKVPRGLVPPQDQACLLLPPPSPPLQARKVPSLPPCRIT
jgi:hypothetical protein